MMLSLSSQLVREKWGACGLEQGEEGAHGVSKERGRVAHSCLHETSPCFSRPMCQVLRLHQQPLVAFGITNAKPLAPSVISDLTGRLDALCFEFLVRCCDIWSG